VAADYLADVADGRDFIRYISYHICCQWCMNLDVTLRGIPLWLLREYIEELGARARDDGVLVGEGWQARLTQVEDFQVGSLKVGQVRLELDGEAASLAAVRPLLEKKLQRAGG
jgi:hypothetical protein